MNKVHVTELSDIPIGSMKTYVVNGKPIAIANVEGELFAVDDRCTHQECSLGTEGFLEGNVITCACHGAQFDVTRGKVMSLPATVDLQTHEVVTEGNDVYIMV